MTPTHLCILVLAIVAVGSVTGQNDEIPVESDNQFPPDAPADEVEPIIEGSGDGTIDEPITDQSIDKTTTPIVPLEDIILPSLNNADQLAGPDNETLCPAKCVCHSAEGDSNSYVVDCSGYDLAEFPTPLDPKTTTLNVQNNKLTEIPKTVSLLKNLQVLNAENNSISDLALGSISELDQLKILKLSNNRLIQYPMDLKNSFGLIKLQELDLGGNDMRTEITPQLFSIFKSLKTLTIPSSILEKETVIENLCASLRESLERVCTDTCNMEEIACSNAPLNLDEDNLLDVIPGMIPFDTPSFLNETSNVETDIGTEKTREEPEATGSAADGKVTDSELPATTNPNDNITLSKATADILRSENKEETSTIQRQSMTVGDVPNEQTNNTDSGVKVGATTDASTGGIDKSVIGFIVAGMVLVVAGITIKKNWGSIRKRFSSSQRHNERNVGTNANGEKPLPEEMPLQDKNPV